MPLQAHGLFLAPSHQPCNVFSSCPGLNPFQRQQLAVWAASQFLSWQGGQGASWKRLWAGFSPLTAPHGLFIALCLHCACPVPAPGAGCRHLT